MSKSVRKVIEIGKCQGITLPAEYLRKVGLEKGDHIQFRFDGEKGVILPLKLRDEENDE